jgi:predicted nicotinamide N-methyase
VQNYQTKNQTITVNHIDYKIRTLKDKQQFYDYENQAESIGISSATWPLFGVVWPVARVLAATVSASELQGKRVLEIGCGIALSSIVLHKMGVDITASDYHPLAEEFLKHNIADNDMLPIKYLTGNWDVENLLLGDYDLIIGSDVLYEPTHAEILSQFIHKHSNNDVEVIIVDPNRGNRSNFTKKMIALGYEHNFDLFNIEGLDDVRCKGRILHYQRALN